MWKIALAALALSACLLPPSYVVTDIHGDQVTKCEVDGRGRVTGVCHDESTDDAPPVTYGTAPQEPDRNPNDEVVPGGLERLAPHAAPTAGQVAQALTAPPVHALLDRCRDAYQTGLDRFAVDLTVAPSGEISQVAPVGVNDQLGACAARAIHTAHLPAFAGGAVAFRQELML
jgi:hypothetical protein